MQEMTKKERRDLNRGNVVFKPAERKSFLRWRNILKNKMRRHSKKSNWHDVVVLKINKKRMTTWPSDLVQLELYRMFGTKYKTKVLFFERLGEVILQRIND
jgi:hypothetical protein